MTAAPPNIPNPDPSLIANERLKEALIIVNATIDRDHKEAKGWIEALQMLLEEKVKQNTDKVTHLKETVGSLATYIDRHTDIAVANLKELINEKSLAYGEAIKVAILSQKEMAANHNTATSELIKSMGIRFEVESKATNDKIDALKSRIDKGEGISKGSGETLLDNRATRALQHSSNQIMIAVIAIAVSLAIAAIGWFSNRAPVIDRTMPSIQRNNT